VRIRSLADLPGTARLAQQQGATAPIAKKPNKYGAQRTERAGVVYASKLEAACAAQLDLEVKGGLIDFYLRQVRFPLEGQTYVADFVTFKRMDIAGLDFAVMVLDQILEPTGHLTTTKKAKIRAMWERYRLHVRLWPSR